MNPIKLALFTLFMWAMMAFMFAAFIGGLVGNVEVGLVAGMIASAAFIASNWETFKQP